MFCSLSLLTTLRNSFVSSISEVSDLLSALVYGLHAVSMAHTRAFAQEVTSCDQWEERDVMSSVGIDRMDKENIEDAFTDSSLYGIPA